MSIPADGLVAGLHDHHERIDQMLVNVVDASGEDRQVVFRWLKRFVAAHEAAEQLFLHPLVDVTGGDPEEAALRLLEEGRIAELMTALEQPGVTEEDFTRLCLELRHVVSRHARAEELQEVPYVLDNASGPDLERIRRALEQVDVLVSHRNGPLREGVHPFVELLDRAKSEFGALRPASGV